MRHSGTNENPDAGPAPDATGRTPLLARPELRLAMLYVLLASTWIAGCDLIFVHILNVPVESILIHTFKGVNFAATTGVLFYLVLRRAYGGWRRAEAERLAVLAASNERFRSLSSRIQTLRESERASISREVHDELGQILTGIKLKVRMIESRLDERDDISLNPQIEDLVEAGEMIDETINAVRRISTGLRPSTLDHLGLATAIRGEAEQFIHRTGVDCRVEIAEPFPELPPVVQTTAFRVCQECLTNVARHSGASRVSVHCRVEEETLELSVADNGAGCPPSVLSAPASLGLIGMRERAEALAGTLDIASSPGSGTTVTLRVPVPSNPEFHTHENPVS
ncbi:MAG: sensor histidine kinase [Verrucomicrobia bacterium]|nr:sensor histidine kinase [Verrucomicrobiota bacterium]